MNVKMVDYKLVYYKGVKIMLKEFKNFAFKGNVLDLAIAVIIGATFGNIVSSLVDHIIMPFFGGITRGINFEELIYYIGDAEVAYGMFIQSIIDFIIIAFSIFLVVRYVLRKKMDEEEAEPEPEIDPQEKLLTEIRDLLKEQNIKGE